MKSLAYGKGLGSAKTVSSCHSESTNPTHSKCVNQKCPLLHPSHFTAFLYPENKFGSKPQHWRHVKILGLFGPPCSLFSARSINRAFWRGPPFWTVHKLNPQLQFCEYTHRLWRPHCLPLLLNILIGSRPISNKYAQSRASYAVYLKRPPVDLAAIPLRSLCLQVQTKKPGGVHNVRSL